MYTGSALLIVAIGLPLVADASADTCRLWLCVK